MQVGQIFRKKISIQLLTTAESYQESFELALQKLHLRDDFVSLELLQFPISHTKYKHMNNLYLFIINPHICACSILYLLIYGSVSFKNKSVTSFFIYDRAKQTYKWVIFPIYMMIIFGREL